jgi:hypothetical protein
VPTYERNMTNLGVLSKILELNVDGIEWDDSEEDANCDKFLPPNDQEFISEEPPYIEHELDEEDCMSPRKEPNK